MAFARTAVGPLHRQPPRHRTRGPSWPPRRCCAPPRAATEWAGGDPADLRRRPQPPPGRAPRGLRRARSTASASRRPPPAGDRPLLVRGLESSTRPAQWPAGARELSEDGRALRLSDHAPVAATFDVRLCIAARWDEIVIGKACRTSPPIADQEADPDGSEEDAGRKVNSEEVDRSQAQPRLAQERHRTQVDGAEVDRAQVHRPQLHVPLQPRHHRSRQERRELPRQPRAQPHPEPRPGPGGHGRRRQARPHAAQETPRRWSPTSSPAAASSATHAQGPGEARQPGPQGGRRPGHPGAQERDPGRPPARRQEVERAGGRAAARPRRRRPGARTGRPAAPPRRRQRKFPITAYDQLTAAR